MTDPDLRRWLSRQTRGPVGLVALDVVRRGPAALRDALDAEGAAGRRLVVVDAVADDDLRTIGAAASGHALVTGGSGVALGLPANLRAAGLLSQGSGGFMRLAGPGLVLSGSCSTASLQQVKVYGTGHPSLALDPAAVLDGTLTPTAVLDWALPQLAQAPIVYSTAAPDAVAAAQECWGRAQAAHGIEAFFGQLAALAVASGVQRLVVGGGETSGAVVSALGLRSMGIGPEIAPGIPALDAGPGLRLALKSGNFGGPRFYEDALAVLERP